MLRKALFIISLISAFSASAQEFVEDNGFFTRKGYAWSPGTEKHYTVTIIDPITNEELQRNRVTYELPDTINGTHVYTTNEIQSSGIPAESKALSNYLLKALQPHIRQAWFAGKTSLQSLTVHLGDIIIDEAGKVVFFELANVTGRVPDGGLRDLEYSRLTSLIGPIIAGAPQSHPATINGKPVMAYADVDLADTEITFDGSDFHFKEVIADNKK